jgi:hypothetical protein
MAPVRLLLVLKAIVEDDDGLPTWVGRLNIGVAWHAGHQWLQVALTSHSKEVALTDAPLQDADASLIVGAREAAALLHGDTLERPDISYVVGSRELLVAFFNRYLRTRFPHELRP